jgi:hypothetical protein
VNYIPAFVNNQIFGGIIFIELVIKCEIKWKPSLALIY